MKIKKVYIELTDEQKEKLKPLFDIVLDATVIDKPVMLLAQIHFSGRRAAAICGIIDNATSLKVQEAIKPKSVGIMADDKFARSIIKKASMT